MKTLNDLEKLPDTCLIKFGATWCAPCRAVKPVLEKVESSTGVTIVDIDIDENSELAEQFGVRSVPTVFAIKNGQPVGMIVGAKGESVYNELVEKLT